MDPTKGGDAPGTETSTQNDATKPEAVPDLQQWESLVRASARLEAVASSLAAQSARPPDVDFQSALLARVAASLESATDKLATALSQASARFAVHTWESGSGTPAPVEGPCDPIDDSCHCSACCCWEIRLVAARMVAGTPAPKPEELVDGETGPLGLGNGFEVILFVAADGIGIVHPALTYPMTLTKLTGQPGGWVSCGNRLLNTVCFKRGTTRPVVIEIQALESDESEPLLGGQNESGTASYTMLLDCCCKQVGPVDIDVSFNLGTGTGEGAIAVRVTANRVS